MRAFVKNSFNPHSHYMVWKVSTITKHFMHFSYSFSLSLLLSPVRIPCIYKCLFPLFIQKIVSKLFVVLYHHENCKSYYFDFLIFTMPNDLFFSFLSWNEKIIKRDNLEEIEPDSLKRIFSFWFQWTNRFYFSFFPFYYEMKCLFLSPLGYSLIATNVFFSLSVSLESEKLSAHFIIKIFWPENRK